MDGVTATEGRDAVRRRSVAASTGAARPAPPAALSPGPLGAAQAAAREISRQTAARARAVAAFAASRPATVDRAQGEKGAMSPERWAARPELLRSVSEWATPELAVALSLTAQAAETELERSLLLVHRLPATLTALEAGVLHVGHLWPLLTHVAPIEDDAVRARVEARLLDWVARPGRVTTPAQLGDKARREALTCDARAAARRLERAIKERGVFLRPEAVDGMASVTAVLTMPEAQALYRTLCALADALDDTPGDVRSRGQKLADVLLDLVLRPGEGEAPPVQVLLTVVTSLSTLLGGDAPGEIDGHVVPAEMIRHLLQGLSGRLTPDLAAADRVPVTDVREPGADFVPTDATARAADPAPAPEVAAAGSPAVGPPPSAAAPIADGDAHAEPAPEAAPAASWQQLDALFDAAVGEQPDSAFERLLAAWLADLEPSDFAPDDLAEDADLAGDPDLPEDKDLPEDRDLPEDQDLPQKDLPEPDDVTVPEGAVEGDGPTDPSPGDRSPGDPAAGVPLTPPPSSAEPKTAPGGGGWWASADRAVGDAAQAVQRAQQELGHAQRLVHTARIADAADEAAAQDTPAGRVNRATDAIEALRAATDVQRNWLAALLNATGGGGLAERPRIALTDALTGTLLALSELSELRRTGHCGASACRRDPAACTHDLAGRPGLGPPGATEGYRPSAALDRWVRARDRRCRFPGCRRRVPKGGELDHQIPYPDGPTSAANLAGFCTTDHRGKHQAPGWRYDLVPDGTLTVTTPTGLTVVTEPPPY